MLTVRGANERLSQTLFELITSILIAFQVLQRFKDPEGDVGQDRFICIRCLVGIASIRMILSSIRIELTWNSYTVLIQRE